MVRLARSERALLKKCHSSRRLLIISGGVLFLLFISLQRQSLNINNTGISTNREESIDESRLLTDLLHLESLKERSYTNDSGRNASKQAAQYFARKFSNSFIAEYEKIDGNCFSRPFRPHLISALRVHHNPLSHTEDISHLVRTYGILLVLIELHTDFNELLRSLMFILESQAMRQILVLDISSNKKHDAIRIASRFLENTKWARIPIKPVQSLGIITDLKLVSTASLVLVHGKYIAALASLMTSGVVYFSDTMVEFAYENKFRWAVEDLRPTNLSIWSENRQFESLFKEMGKVNATCCDLAAFGNGDDRKVVCRNSRSLVNTRETGKKNSLETSEQSMNAKCWVLSLGCGGKWSFETSVIANTDCVVQVFDCTGNFSVPNELRKRVTLHNICLGVRNDERFQYRSFSELIEIGAVSSYLPAKTAPALVKMDIEGWEHPILHELLDDIEKKDETPEQLVVEIHSLVRKDAWYHYSRKVGSNHGLYRPSLVELFKKFRKYGYVLVHRADNTLCAGCTEVTLIKEEALP